MNPYKIVESIDNFIYSCINFMSSCVFFITKDITEKKKALKKNNELKNITSDTCIICGNGPSLNEFDFNSVKEVPTFTVNYFFNGNIDIPGGSSYQIVIDDGFTREIGENLGLDYILKAYTMNPDTKFIFRYDMIDKIKPIDGALSHAFFVYYQYIQYENKLKCDMSGMMTACHNVVLMALQCAISMGYKNIYLIGCENNFFSSYTHFYDSIKPNFKPASWRGLNYVDMAFKHYDAIRLYADRNGINIYNITPKSYINSFVEVPLDEFYRSYIKQE